MSRSSGCGLTARRLVFWILLFLAVAYLCRINRQIRDFVLTPVTMIQQVSSGMELQQVGRALELFRIEKGHYPPEDGFHTFMNNAFQSQLKNVNLDHWNVAYRYRSDSSNTEYEVRSAGPDKQFETRDDLIVRGKV